MIFKHIFSAENDFQNWVQKRNSFPMNSMVKKGLGKGLIHKNIQNISCFSLEFKDRNSWGFS